MKRSVLIVLLLTSAGFAKVKAKVGIPCSKAIVKAEVDAANRKWSSQRPDPNAPVLNLATSVNYAKAILLGSFFSHVKKGELTFSSTSAGGCRIQSNGHPADVIAKDLRKKYAHVSPANPDQAKIAALEAQVAALKAAKSAKAKK